MKFNYKLRRLCGAHYGYPVDAGKLNASNQWNGSNLVYDSTGNLLISAVFNRIQVVDLKLHTIRTLSVEARSNICQIALSPDDVLLIAVDVKNYAVLVSFHRGFVLHRHCFQRRVLDISFSPNGQFLSVTHSNAVQVWCTPSLYRKEFSPLTLHKTFGGVSDDVTCLAWSFDGSVLAGGCKDSNIRVWILAGKLEPVTLFGHRRPIVALFFMNDSQHEFLTLYSISEDGAIVSWISTTTSAEKVSIDEISDDENDSSEENRVSKRFKSSGDNAIVESRNSNINATWKMENRHYFHQDGAKVTSAAYSKSGQILAVGFSSGLFALYELPAMTNVHTLSVGANQLIKGCTLNNSGDWIALGCPKSQQLFVWEWQSETYVLKQRGHAYGMSCMAYSPDGVVICTGGEDSKLKLWNSTSGFCYVTLDKSHTSAVTAVAFANNSVVLSASLDGTVRAHDLHRYRNFKTFTSPLPVQFLSLAIDPSGEIVCAGTADPFHIYTWGMQTATILDVLSGHGGPVCALAFQAGGSVLVSGSWDGGVKMWNLYNGSVPSETLQHKADVVCLACRPDGKEICAGTVRGVLSFWNTESSKLLFEIDGRKDICGGRKMNDRFAANNNASSRYFTTICYSADGSLLLAGGNSKYVCIYETSQQVLLRKIQISFNRSFDGILDKLNSKNQIDGMPVDDQVDCDEEGRNTSSLPGARRGDDGSRSSKIEVIVRQLAFSPTGREWGAISGEGLHIYALDDEMIFDPIQLTEALTPAAVEAKLMNGEFSAALRMAININEGPLIKKVIEGTPFDLISLTVKAVAPQHLERLIHVLAQEMAKSPHIEFYLMWCIELLQFHGLNLERRRNVLMKSFRALYRTVLAKFEELKAVTDDNKYMLGFLEDQGWMRFQESKFESSP